eukprot:CAMPEP_0115150340 /NCGR_PEP_ID=MMETSP0227-20121206/64990_1 /TAXON_ID=89957 /ORGANISM="Polarella glacialis, Strain CCMP 1383" /LENGTH=463 /DNA_ID=CAMNT_0002560705 /DNA_START=137 /DNA_END=1528 /DNA_ORIENTATION=+
MAIDDDTTYTSFFSETSQGQHVPRAIFVDTDPTTRDEIFASDYGRLFHPEHVLGYKQDCKNNFFEGRSMASQYKIKDDVMDRVRLAVDLCSNLQGFFVFHSFGGGTGSGVGVEVLHDLHEQFAKKVIFQPTIYPSHQFSSCIVEPYNCIFATHYMRDVVDLSLMMDNEAAYRMCTKNLGIEGPDFEHVNRIIAQCISACTTSLRYEAQLNATLQEIVTNLVPTQHYRYPVVSLAPVRAATKGAHEHFSTQEIITDLFEAKNILCDCGGNLKMNRYLAAVILLRGVEDPMSEATEDGSMTKTMRSAGGYTTADNTGCKPMEANSVITSLQRLMQPVGSHRSPIRFVPWVAFGFKVGLVGVPPAIPKGFMAQTRRQGAMLGNTTAVRQLFVRQYTKFLKLFYHRAYVWQFLDANGEIDLFYEARDGVREIIGHYEELLNQCAQGENEKHGENTMRVEGKTSMSPA